MAQQAVIDELQSLRRSKPFKPFALKPVNGASIHVLQPTRFGANGDRICVFPLGGGMRLFRAGDVEGVRLLSDAEIKTHNTPFYLRKPPKRSEEEN